MKIGLLITATNKYIQFLSPLAHSAEKYFLKNHEVTLFLFTDHAGVTVAPRQLVIETPHTPWPGPALNRYGIYASSSACFKDMDYVFNCDVDMRFVSEVGDEILGSTVGTIHPGFYNKDRSAFFYETNPRSRAFMDAHEGVAYYAGAFNGGATAAYVAMCAELDSRIKQDASHGITAIWHDESHLNRYFFDHPPELKLSPSYCYPESWTLPFQPRLLALDKDHARMRDLPVKRAFLRRIKKFLKGHPVS